MHTKLLSQLEGGGIMTGYPGIHLQKMLTRSTREIIDQPHIITMCWIMRSTMEGTFFLHAIPWTRSGMQNSIASLPLHPCLSNQLRWCLEYQPLEPGKGSPQLNGHNCEQKFRCNVRHVFKCIVQCNHAAVVMTVFFSSCLERKKNALVSIAP